MHLAQLNVGRLRAPLDDTLIDDFRNNLEPVNALGPGGPLTVSLTRTLDLASRRTIGLPRPRRRARVMIGSHRG